MYGIRVFTTAQTGMRSVSVIEQGTWLRQLTLNLLDRTMVTGGCVGLLIDVSLEAEDDGHLGEFHKNVTVMRLILDPTDPETQREVNEGAERKLSSLIGALNAGCGAFFIQTLDPVLAIRALAQAARRASVRANRRYVILPPPQTSDSLETPPAAPETVFSMKEMAFLPDLIIARMKNSSETSEDLEIDLVTHRFVGSTPHKVLHLDTWTPNDGFMTGADLFPDKISDLQGKQLTVASIHYPPYTLLLDENNQPSEEAETARGEGTEWEMGREWLKAHRATWRQVTDDQLWGVVWANGSGNGLSGFISEDRADLAFGSMYLWLYEYQFMDFTAPYYRTAVTCLAPRPHQLPPYLVPFLALDRATWAAVGGLLVAAAVSVFATTRATTAVMQANGRGSGSGGRYATLGESALCAWGVLLLQAPPDERLRPPLRHLLAWLLVTALLLAAGYGAGLSSNLTVPRCDSLPRASTNFFKKNN